MMLPRRGRVPIGRPLGIPVYLHFSWAIVFGLIAWTLATGYFPALEPGQSSHAYWVEGLLASLLLFACVLVHEMAHAVVARRAGLQIRSVTLFLFGGVAEMERDPEDGRTEFRIAAAGPLVSLALAGLFALATAAPGLPAGLRSVGRYLAWINAVVAIFNLIPAFPLDGGRMLRGLFWKSMGRSRATRAAAGAGTVFAFFLILSGVIALLRGAPLAGFWYVAMGWFLQEASGGAYQEARLHEMFGDVRVRDVMVTQVDTLPGEISLAEAATGHFLHTGYGSYPVESGGKVVGLLCLRDLLGTPPAEREGTSVQGAMRKLSPTIVVGPDEPLLSALARLAQGDAGRLLVVENDQLVGLLPMSAISRQVAVRNLLARS
jgi:Zn-dependent protease/CBS domain-containing protein